MINTKFWSDWYVLSLDPSEKLLFLYYLTNEKTDLCGIYEIPLKIVSFDTGYDKDMIIKIEDRFSENYKLYRYGDWIYITNFVKNQLKNPSIEKWIQRSLDLIPKKIKDYFWSIELTDCDRLSQTGTPKLKPEPKLKPKEEKKGKTPPPVDRWLKSYGDYVKMTPEEYQKLIDTYGEKHTKNYIYEIDLYVWSTGQTSKYKDYYKTVLAWIHKAGIKKIDKTKKPVVEQTKEMTEEERQENMKKLAALKSTLK